MRKPKKEMKLRARHDVSTPVKKRVNSRTKGHNCERKYAKIFREEFGFEKCKTSREASKLLDDSKVDLAFLPYNIQIKKGYERVRPRYEKIFKEMKESLANNFPEDDPIINNYKVIIHELNNAREVEDVLVIMPFNEWADLVNYNKQNKYNGKAV